MIKSRRESGGEVFHIGSAEKIGEVTKRIEEELRSQYIVAFRTTRRSRRRVPRGHGRGGEAGRDGEDDQGVYPVGEGRRAKGEGRRAKGAYQFRHDAPFAATVPDHWHVGHESEVIGGSRRVGDGGGG